MTPEPARDNNSGLIQTEFGVSGSNLLFKELNDQELRALGAIVTQRLSQFVSPDQVKELHAELSDDVAKVTAKSLSLGIVQQRLKAMPGVQGALGHMDCDQLLAGTRAASRDTLEQLCLVLGESPDELIALAKEG